MFNEERALWESVNAIAHSSMTSSEKVIALQKIANAVLTEMNKQEKKS